MKSRNIAPVLAAAAIFIMPLAVSCEGGNDELSTVIRLDAHRLSLDSETNRKDTMPAEDAILYLFYADSTGWGVFDREDAKAGVVRDRIYVEETNQDGQNVIVEIRRGEQTLSPAFTATMAEFTDESGEATGAGTYIRSGPLVEDVAFAVVYDPLSQMYGWKEIPLAAGLPVLRLSVWFDTTSSTDYYDSRHKWRMFAGPGAGGEDGPPDPQE